MDRSRRWFVTRLPLAFVSVPRAAEAQHAGRGYRIGWLSMAFRGPADLQAAFTEALQERGYDARHTLLEYRFADGSAERLASMADELVRSKVDILVTDGTPAALAAKRATTSIPIVMMGPADPVGVGLVSSLARPGGNVTGMSAAIGDIAAKGVALLQELVPRISRIAFLGNATNVVNRATFSNAKAAADRLGVVIDYVSATTPSEIPQALASVGKSSVQGAIVSADGVIGSRIAEIVQFMARGRLPAVYFRDTFVEAGGLMSYGPRSREFLRGAAVYVDKILKGAKPADLPIEQPLRFDLVLNVKTAKAQGLTIPPSLLLRADRVIE
jgi:putative tryptophan/tyrosine transport system substrate-binding protein